MIHPSTPTRLVRRTEERSTEGDLTADALRQLLHGALVDRYEALLGDSPWGVWVRDVAEDWVAFEVDAGYTGAIHLDVSFPAITALGGGYDVGIEVTNDVPIGDGSHTLAIADPHEHTIDLIPEPATVMLLALGGVAVVRRRSRRCRRRTRRWRR